MAVDRRQFLAGAAALGGATILDRLGLAAQGAQSGVKPFRIDTHSHFTIPKLYDLAAAHGTNQATLKDWSPAKICPNFPEKSVSPEMSPPTE